MKAPSTAVSARIRRSVLLALALTPLLLFTGTARHVVSLEATITAVALGVLLGGATVVGLTGVDLGEADDVMMTVVALLAVGVATLVVWLVVPPHHLGTLTQFTVAFIWAVPAAEYLRHRRREGDSP